jgi:two-component system sensor kinase FixL
VDDADRNVLGVGRGELERLRAVSGLADTLAHKINQPLTAASAYLRAAQRLTGALSGETVAPIVEALDKASLQIVRAGEAVRGLSELAALGEPDKADVRLNPLIEETIVLVAEDAADAGVSIIKRLTEDDDCIFADRVQIKHVLVNLLRNAIGAMRGSSQRELLISTSTDVAGAIRFEIQDSGCGTGQREDTRLFEFFATQQKEAGIGLLISQAIVEAHNGRLWAKANPDGSAIFSCDLPLRGREFNG